MHVAYLLCLLIIKFFNCKFKVKSFPDVKSLLLIVFIDSLKESPKEVSRVMMVRRKAAHSIINPLFSPEFEPELEFKESFCILVFLH